MTTLAIKKQFEAYLPLLTKQQQELLLQMVKNILQVEPQKKRIGIKQYNTELEASLKQMRDGKTISHAALLKEVEQW